MQIETLLSFKARSFSGEDFLKLLKTAIDFEVKKFSVDEIKDAELNYSDKYLSKIAKCSSEAELMFRTDHKGKDKNEQFWIMESAHSKSPQTLYWFLNDRYPSMNILMELTSNKNFTTGYICDFQKWKNKKSISNYENYEKDHNTLPKVFDEDFKKWQIDIKKCNPGHSSLVADMWLQSSYIMLFGVEFIKLVSKERLLNYPHAYNSKVLPNGVVFIQLFKEIKESATTESLKNMKDFRAWIEMDKLEAALK